MPSPALPMLGTVAPEWRSGAVQAELEAASCVAEVGSGPRECISKSIRYSQIKIFIV